MLCYIYNVCLLNSLFPSPWKQAVSVLIHKSNKPRDLPSSYRPISLLPVFGKIFESLLASRITDYMNRFNLFSPFQAGFRKGYCTSDQVLRLIHDISHNLNSKNHSLACFFDAEKAFDKLWHNGLIYILNSLGLPTKIIRLLIQFLRTRSVQFKVNNTLSEKLTLKAGTPQGSPLSPLLFIIYINEIPSIFPDFCKVSLYADDLAIWTNHPNFSVTHNRLQTAIAGLHRWCTLWRINLNPTKSQILHFSNGYKKFITNIKLNNKLIPVCKEVRFLGFIIDNKLSFRSHFKDVEARASARINSLYRLAGYWKKPIAPPKNYPTSLHPTYQINFRLLLYCLPLDLQNPTKQTWEITKQSPKNLPSPTKHHYPPSSLWPSRSTNCRTKMQHLTC